MTTTAIRPEDRADADGSPSVPSAGLHGHSFETPLLVATIVETIGTFVLVLAIAGAAVAATLAKPIAGSAYDSLTIALTGAITLVALVAGAGPISGAHFNPAVTVGLAVNRKFPWTRVPAYVLGQFAGSVAAALIVWWFYGPKARSVAHLGATSHAPEVTAWQAFGAETVATFLLVIVIVAVATGARPSKLAPLAIGAALGAAILISGPISGAGVNPARAIGPMIAAGRYSDWWVYLLAPLLGAMAAVMVGSRIARFATASE